MDKYTKNKRYTEHVKCECGYNNLPENVKQYGTCTKCGKVLDGKAKFRRGMYHRLRLWKGTHWY